MPRMKCRAAAPQAIGRGPRVPASAAWRNDDVDGLCPTASMRQDAAAYAKRRVSEEASVMQVTAIGLDLARDILQVRGMEAEGKAVVRRALRCQGGYRVLRKSCPPPGLDRRPRVGAAQPDARHAHATRQRERVHERFILKRSWSRARIALSKATICWRNCCQATSMGRTISAPSERSSSRASSLRSKGNSRIAPGRRPNVSSTPRMGLDYRAVMPMRCLLASRRARKRWRSNALAHGCPANLTPGVHCGNKHRPRHAAAGFHKLHRKIDPSYQGKDGVVVSRLGRFFVPIVPKCFT